MFFIESEAQFDSVKQLMVYLRDETEISFDIVVPDATSEDTDFNKDVYDGGARIIEENGFSVTRSVDGVVLSNDITSTQYKVLLSAYMYHWHYDHLKVKYRIMFPYASYYFNKPNWTVGRFISDDYLADALLSHAVGTKPITDIFTKTHIVPSLKLMEFSKNSKIDKKPVLFFAPTYNEIDFAVKFLDDIDTIKEKYTVAMRSHHRTSHVDADRDVSMKLYEKADRVYDVDECSIVEPLEEADIVVSDNSAVIFDAIYCGVPVAIFSHDPNGFRYKDINTMQFNLVSSGDILWTSRSNEILNVVDETLTVEMLNRQKLMRDRLFPKDAFIDPLGSWVDVLLEYINDNLPHEYSLAKSYWVDSIRSNSENAISRRIAVDQLNQQISKQEILLDLERNPGVKASAKRLLKACIYKIGLKRRGM